MSEGGGLSAGQVQSIVSSMISGLESDVRSLNSEVNSLQSSVRSIQKDVRRLEEEMSQMANAVNAMSKSLGDKLDNLNSLQKSTKDITKDGFDQTKSGLGQIQTVSAAGFVAVSGGLEHVSGNVKVVDGSLQTLTRATVQMEVIRLLNEARGPVQRILGFSEEIDQRFAKALESVYLVRAQYDHLTETAKTEYSQKLRNIGDHIYAIYDQDFREHAELPLSTPSEQVFEITEDLDERILESRSQALDADLTDFGTETLEPLLSQHQAFEHSMASAFAVTARGLGENETVGVPATLRLWNRPEEPVEVVAAARLRPQAGTGSHEGLRYAIEPDAGLTSWTQGLAQHGAEFVAQSTTRRMTPAEIGGLKDALSKLAQSGQIEPSMLQGYYDYLERFGLEIAEQGTVMLQHRGDR